MKSQLISWNNDENPDVKWIFTRDGPKIEDFSQVVQQYFCIDFCCESIVNQCHGQHELMYNIVYNSYL